MKKKRSTILFMKSTAGRMKTISTKKITVTDPSLEEPLQHTEKVAKFSLGDFTDMLAYQRLQVKEVFGDYQLQPYDTRKTPRLILIASKG
jgi:hypothetical protein